LNYKQSLSACAETPKFVRKYALFFSVSVANYEVKIVAHKIHQNSHDFEPKIDVVGRDDV